MQLTSFLWKLCFIYQSILFRLYIKSLLQPINIVRTKNATKQYAYFLCLAMFNQHNYCNHLAEMVTFSYIVLGTLQSVNDKRKLSEYRSLNRKIAGCILVVFYFFKEFCLYLYYFTIRYYVFIVESW